MPRKRPPLQHPCGALDLCGGAPAWEPAVCCTMAEQESAAAQGAMSWAERENHSALTTHTLPPTRPPAEQMEKKLPASYQRRSGDFSPKGDEHPCCGEDPFHLALEN